MIAAAMTGKPDQASSTNWPAETKAFSTAGVVRG